MISLENYKKIRFYIKLLLKMQKNVRNNSKFRIVIKNNHLQTRSSSRDSIIHKQTKNNNIDSQKSSTVSQKNDQFLNLVRKKSQSANRLNIQNNQSTKQRFTATLSMKPLMKNQNRHLSLNNRNLKKSTIAANRKSTQSNDPSNQQPKHDENDNLGKQKTSELNIQQIYQIKGIDSPKFCLLQSQKNIDQQKNKIYKIQSGTQTQKIQCQKQLQNEYLKFKITKRQKFQKIQNLFTFFQNLSKVQHQNFVHYAKGFNTQDENKRLYNQRQKRIQKLKTQLNYSYSNLCEQFKTNIITANQNMIQQLFNQEPNNHYNRFYKKYIINIKNQIIQNFQFKPSQKNKIQKIFLKVENDLENINIFRNQQLSSIKDQIQDLNNKLKQQFNVWQNKIIQYTTIIKNCVINISELPEMCAKLFGYGQSKDHDKTNDQIKKLGVNIEKIPNISDFFTRNDSQNLEEIDKAFSKCCQIKCMNCVYIRSKMKYIYMKNIQLQPIKKALLNLTENKHQINKNFTRLKLDSII